MKAQIPWLRVFVEGVVIVGSILLAFGLQAWWDGVQERIEEREIIERLISDVRADVQNIERGLSFLPRKEEGLLRVDSLLNAPDPSPQDPVMFLEDVIYGSQYGWSQAVAQRITFDELLGSGAFGLIRDAELRVAISDYYEDHARLQRRIDERETEYPSISYRLVPRHNEFELAPDLSEAQLERLVSGVFESVLREHVISEINLAGFIGTEFGELRQTASDLLSELETYGGRIE